VRDRCQSNCGRWKFKRPIFETFFLNLCLYDSNFLAKKNFIFPCRGRRRPLILFGSLTFHHLRKNAKKNHDRRQKGSNLIKKFKLQIFLLNFRKITHFKQPFYFTGLGPPSNEEKNWRHPNNPKYKTSQLGRAINVRTPFNFSGRNLQYKTSDSL